MLLYGMFATLLINGSSVLPVFWPSELGLESVDRNTLHCWGSSSSIFPETPYFLCAQKRRRKNGRWPNNMILFLLSNVVSIFFRVLFGFLSNNKLSRVHWQKDDI